MPRAKDGHTHITVEVPNEILAKLRERGGSMTAHVCAVLARELGVRYEQPKLGRKPKSSEGK